MTRHQTEQPSVQAFTKVENHRSLTRLFLRYTESASLPFTLISIGAAYNPGKDTTESSAVEKSL